jgi:hypothetical protein
MSVHASKPVLQFAFVNLSFIIMLVLHFEMGFEYSMFNEMHRCHINIMSMYRKLGCLWGGPLYQHSA